MVREAALKSSGIIFDPSPLKSALQSDVKSSSWQCHKSKPLKNGSALHFAEGRMRGSQDLWNIITFQELPYRPTTNPKISSPLPDVENLSYGGHMRQWWRRAEVVRRYGWG